MKLLFCGNVIAKSDSIDELRECKRKFIRQQRKFYTDLLAMYGEIEKERKSIPPRGEEESKVDYKERLTKTYPEFVHHVEILVENFFEEIDDIIFINVPHAYKNIYILTPDETISFGTLNGLIRNSIPTSSMFKIEE